MVHSSAGSGGVVQEGGSGVGGGRGGGGICRANVMKRFKQRGRTADGVRSHKNKGEKDRTNTAPCWSRDMPLLRLKNLL